VPYSDELGFGEQNILPLETLAVEETPQSKKLGSKKFKTTSVTEDE